MFLVSSAASLHGHEFSGPVENNPAPRSPRRNALGRSAFSTPLPRRNTTYAESTLFKIEPRPGRPLSERIHKVHEHVRFQEPRSDAMSEDGRSVANSEGSMSTVDGRKRKRRSLRNSSVFHLAHPAPTLTAKQRLLQIRPRLLFQLQQLRVDSRPIPAFDVVPSTMVVPRLIKRFPRMFRGKGELGANDIMVLRSEEYNTHLHDLRSADGTDSDEEGLASRDLIAVICAKGTSTGTAEIALSDGSVWEATPLTSNLYEFVSVDSEGNKIIARWVKRNASRKSVDLSEASFNTQSGNDFRFTFSIIDPLTRRHPILASLTPTKLDIPDRYFAISSSAAMKSPSSLSQQFPDDADSFIDEETTSERTTYRIDERVKTLIQVTGVWVALRRGLSPYFKYSDPLASATSSSSNSRASGRARSMSLNPEPSHASPSMNSFASACESTNNTGSFNCKMRRSYIRASPGSCASSITENTLPKRSVSTGSAFMQRASARKANGNNSTVPSDSEGELSVQLPKRAATDGFVATISSFPSSNVHLKLPGSELTTPQETPTKPRRQVQSAYIPSSALQHNFTNKRADRRSLDLGEMNLEATKPHRPKPSRWKSFTNLFRRSRARAS